jgi:hypothetical protein
MLTQLPISLKQGKSFPYGVNWPEHKADQSRPCSPETYSTIYCNVDGQSIAKQRLSKHGITQRTMEVRVFIARCWATSSAPMNSPARNHVTCFLCCQRRDRCYTVISAQVSTMEVKFSLCGRRGGYITSSNWSQCQFFSSVGVQYEPVWSQFSSK